MAKLWGVPKARETLYDRLSKLLRMDVVPPPYNRKHSCRLLSILTLMIHSDKRPVRIRETQILAFASCVSSVKSLSSKTNEPLAFAPSSVAFQTMSETTEHQPSSTNVDSSFSVKEEKNIPASVPAGSKNRPAYVPALQVGELLVKPQQVVLGEIQRLNYAMGIQESMEKLDDFVKIIGGTVTFGGGDAKSLEKDYQDFQIEL
ncbi:hypothetical protein Tco_0891405 [Tanacetum coccineum]|uniref:Uncharacterized protein n=1 Tax=Tanacetum coccineum TaxID=301880 RepID=A0ABQ5C670_9ASTR